MNAKGLAESIILQSFEDLWSKHHQKESIDFFTSDAFRQCAEIARMNVSDQIKLLTIVSCLIRKLRKPIKQVKMKKKSAHRHSKRHAIHKAQRTAPVSL